MGGTLPSSDRLALFRSVLPEVWSKSSSTLWTAENPAAGHCGVTTLVANDLFGGDIFKTRYGDIWHYYNAFGGVRCDFTDSQFAEPIDYSDTASTREEAFKGTNAAQYSHLKSALQERLKLLTLQ